MSELMWHTITDVPGIRVGHAETTTGYSGCTVVLIDGGAVAGVDVRGGAPGTRDTDLLSPVNVVEEVHAILLTGGSVFGLDAATGVTRYLEEQDVGLDMGVAHVPIVPAAVIFDLAFGDPSIRPNADMGYLAAQRASKEPVSEGNVGAGMGATVGKLTGMLAAMKGGLGSASMTLPNGLVVGAVVAVNAVGNVRNPDTGQWVAGARGPDGSIIGPDELLARFVSQLPGTNTTIAVVASNARLTKAQVNKVAQMAHDGLARTIYPVHTMHDGDTVFAVATGGEASPKSGSSAGVDAPVDVVGALSAQVLSEAVLRAVQTAESLGGLPAARDL